MLLDSFGREIKIEQKNLKRKSMRVWESMLICQGDGYQNDKLNQ